MIDPIVVLRAIDTKTIALEVWNRAWIPIRAGLIAGGLAALGYIIELVSGLNTTVPLP